MDKVRIEIECSFFEEDCFAYHKGECSILTDTDFGKRKQCPFYKPKGECDVEKDGR